MKITASLRGFVLVSFLASSCSTLRMQTGDLPVLIHGMPYYLPIGVITIAGEYKEPTTTNKPSKVPPTSDQSVPHSDSVAFAFMNPAAKKDPAKEEDAAPAGNVVMFKIDNWTITISSDVEADPDEPQYVVPQRNYIFDDEYAVKVNAKHLLSSGKTTVEDRTASIAGDIAGIVGKVLEVARVAAPSESSREPFSLTFHPTIPGEIDTVRKALDARKFGFDVTSSEILMTNRDAALTEAMEHGLTFRLAIPYTVHLSREGPSHRILDHTHQFLLPGTQTYVFDYRRMPFVKKVNDIGFTDGMLTEYHENLPSPILGIVGIPKAILQALIPLPSGTDTAATATTSTTGSPASP